MPRQKINNRPCSIYNCDKYQANFRCLTQLAIRKAIVKQTIQQYPYLQIGQQVCHSHYMVIVENENIEHEKTTIP
ncbi:4757_t:CDS:1, partial [Racocetra persica]